MTDKHLIEQPYLTSATARLHEALLIAPGAALVRVTPIYGEPSPILDRAQEQHAVLAGTLRDLGVLVHDLEIADESGYTTFVADAALVLDHGAIALRPSRIERRREVALVEERLTAYGIPLLGRIEAPGLIDGSDIAIMGSTAFVGVPSKGHRSNTIGRGQLDAILSTGGIKVVELAMAPEIPRLRDVFSVVADDCVVAAPDYVDLAPLGSSAQIIAVPRGDQCGAGVLTIGPRRVIANLRFRFALPILRKAKINVTAIDLWEFGKVGAGPASLVLPLKRG